MSKAPKPETQPQPKPDSATEGPKAAAIEALCNIVEFALAFRNEGRPTLTAVAKLSSRASGLLKLDADQKIDIENAAAVALAKKLNLVS